MKSDFRILVVDDDLGMRETLPDILLEMEYRVNVAKDGFHALSLVETGKWDIVFMDVKMPGISGIDTFKKIKQMSPQSRIVMMTAYSIESLIRERLEEEDWEMMDFPLDTEQIAFCVQAIPSGKLIMLPANVMGQVHSIEKLLQTRSIRFELVGKMEAVPVVFTNLECQVIVLEEELPALSAVELFREVKDSRLDLHLICSLAPEPDLHALIEEVWENRNLTCLHKPLDLELLVALIGAIEQRQRSLV